MTKDSNQDDGLFLYFHYILTSFFRRRKKIERRWMGMGEWNKKKIPNSFVWGAMDGYDEV